MGRLAPTTYSICTYGGDGEDPVVINQSHTQLNNTADHITQMNSFYILHITPTEIKERIITKWDENESLPDMQNIQ
jgi:hypothetical protein